MHRLRRLLVGLYWHPVAYPRRLICLQILLPCCCQYAEVIHLVSKINYEVCIRSLYIDFVINFQNLCQLSESLRSFRIDQLLTIFVAHYMPSYSSAHYILVLDVRRSRAFLTRWKVLWESTNPRESVFVANTWHHLPHLLFCGLLVSNFPTELFCKQSPVYGGFRPLLPHPSTNYQS